MDTLPEGAAVSDAPILPSSPTPTYITLLRVMRVFDI